jgi:lipopolysaccharide export system protein LptA
MSYRSVMLALASCSFLAAQGNQAKPDPSKQNSAPSQQVRVDSHNVVGNEKTVGATGAGNVRASQDRNTIGNAKTVGGDVQYAAVSNSETVGNSKTVGAR